jgi:hypothetical protein
VRNTRVEGWFKVKGLGCLYGLEIKKVVFIDQQPNLLTILASLPLPFDSLPNLRANSLFFGVAERNGFVVIPPK